ncbi:MAG: CHAT domain-containing protein, partial [Holophagales bacterium]|nr:CHAT domain-containing protein [Holophagales bacterium]
MALGELDAAERALGSALRLALELGRHRAAAQVRLNLADLALERGRPDHARQLADEALAWADGAGDPQTQASVYYFLAWAEQTAARKLEAEAAAGPDPTIRNLVLAHLKTARSWLRLALDEVDAVRGDARAAAVRVDYFASKREYAERLVDLLAWLDRLEPGVGWGVEAFETSERSRARALAEGVSLARSELDRGLSTSLDARLLAEEAELAAELRRSERQRLRRLRADPLPAAGLEPTAYASAAEEAPLGALERRQRRLALRLAEVRAQLHSQLPAGASRTAELLRPPDPNLGRLRQLLGPGSLLLEILVGQEQSHLWLVSSEQGLLLSRLLPPGPELDALALQAHRNLASSRQGPASRRQSSRDLQALSELLLAPIARHLGDLRLAVVAEGGLQYVPFAALPDPRSPTGTPLGERHAVVMLPSATSLELLRRPAPRRPTRELAVVADPLFSVRDPRLPSPSSPTRSEPAYEGPRRLPATAEEARAILELLPPGPVRAGSRAYLGTDAHLGLLEGGELTPYRVLHFATHGQVH